MKPPIPRYLQTSPYLAIEDFGGRTGSWLRRVGLARLGRSVHDRLSSRRTFASPSLLRVIESCRTPRPAAELLASPGLSERRLAALVERGVLVDAPEAWRATRVAAVEIEISSHCNWRCVYCPVSREPKPAVSMDLDLFQAILEKAQAHPPVRAVHFEAYNEPTLDPHFEERVRRLAKTRLKLRLYTNGSALGPAKTDLLRETGVLEFVRFNLPAVEEAAFLEMTGSSTFQQTIRNIDYARSAGLPVQLSIQGTREEIRRNSGPLRDRYGSEADRELRGSGAGTPTTDRAGTLRDGRYARGARIAGPLGGCHLPLRTVVIGVHGDLYLCCEDFHQKTVFANIRDGSLEELLASPRAQALRRKVFGADPAEDDFICRGCVYMDHAVKRVSH
ncbi:MAG: radical SAM protein [Elusimicrobia bacterium]|nr:radical SAM protein [Elusimicrobiota bacterium]